MVRKGHGVVVDWKKGIVDRIGRRLTYVPCGIIVRGIPEDAEYR